MFAPYSEYRHIFEDIRMWDMGCNLVGGIDEAGRAQPALLWQPALYSQKKCCPMGYLTKTII